MDNIVLYGLAFEAMVSLLVDPVLALVLLLCDSAYLYMSEAVANEQ